MSVRTKTGCITCRIRRVKCDQNKPACNKCFSSGRVCDGYLTAEVDMPRRQLAEAVRKLDVIGPASRALMQIPTSSHSVSKPVTSNDTALFDTFRMATVPSTCSLFTSAFWSETVMQMAHGESAIWHAVLAVGALHRRAEASSQNYHDGHDGLELTRRAEHHYCKAMALARELSSDLEIATLSAVLVTAASLLGHWSDMQKHVLGGLQVVARVPHRTQSLRCVEGTLLRLDFHAMTFSESSSPYPYFIAARTFPLDHLLSLPYIEGLSYDELSSELLSLFRAYMLLDDRLIQGNIGHGPWITAQETFLRRLAHWEKRMAIFATTHRHTPEDDVVRLCIRLWHVTLRIYVRASSIGYETRFDSLLGHFEYSLKLATMLRDKLRSRKAVSFTLEPGLITPLWVLIHRCRHPWIRHAALEILKGVDRVEAMWENKMAAAVIKALVLVEENSFGHVPPACPITGILTSPAALIPWNTWSRSDLDLQPTLSWTDIPIIPEKSRVKSLLGLMSIHRSRVEVCLLMCADPSVSSSGLGPVRELTVEI